MNIILVVNKFLDRGQSTCIDGGYYNFYIPLIELGHKVYLYDTINGDDKSFNEIVQNFKPDLIFCIMTGNNFVTPYEPYEQIKEITKNTNIKTFNWFCDDTWRFDTFNKNICKDFTYCSTPEKNYINKYKEIGYENILLGNWHCNEDLLFKKEKVLNVSFCGGQTQSRFEIFNDLKNSEIDLKYFYGLAYEDVMKVYSFSKIGLNLTVNDNDLEKKPQMKLRIFEVVAGKSLLLTEHAENLEDFFEIGEEIETFSTITEAKDKINFYLKNDSAREKIANSGHARFLKEHTSKIRLKNILQQINK
jgi:spore maturation protein CgeB